MKGGLEDRIRVRAAELGLERIGFSRAGLSPRGEALRSFLAYPTPVSVHGKPRDWNRELNGAWHDHAVIQFKVKSLPAAADAAQRSFE